MSNLRNKLIRLAHAKPELRKDILPLLGKVADKKDKNGLYPKDTIMVSKKGDEQIKIVDHKINQAMRAQQNKTQYDYVVQVLSGKRSGKEFKLTMNQMDSRYTPKFGKKAGYDAKGIFWEYVGTDYDNQIAYRDDVVNKWVDSLEDALKLLASKKGEAKRKGFKGRGIRFEKESWNEVAAHVRGSSDQIEGDELFYHHIIKFQGFDKDELKALISLISKF